MAEHKTNIIQHPTQPAGRLAYFDDRTALHLTQAFANEVELQPLLKLLFSQFQATVDLRGMEYAYQPLNIDLQFGQRDRHSADYNLSFREASLGRLTLFFPRPQHEQALQTCEDLISIAFASLRNVVTVLALRDVHMAPAITTHGAAVAPLPTEKKTDALILLALDEYSNIETHNGEEWAQILMSSVHEQVREGLRNADGVYHIGDDLIAVLLPNTTPSQAEEVAKKVRILIASLHLRGGDISQQLTACMGLSAANSAASAEHVMANAKLALASAQREGTNQICIFGSEEQSGTVS